MNALMILFVLVLTLQFGCGQDSLLDPIPEPDLAIQKFEVPKNTSVDNEFRIFLKVVNYGKDIEREDLIENKDAKYIYVTLYGDGGVYKKFGKIQLLASRQTASLEFQFSFTLMTGFRSNICKHNFYAIVDNLPKPAGDGVIQNVKEVNKRNNISEIKYINVTKK